jgi:predicted permease
VVRQVLTESILLSGFGGAVGLVVAFATTRLILHFAFPSLPGFATVPINSAPSGPVLLFAFGTSVMSGLLFGIVPGWMTRWVDPIEALRGGRSTTRVASLPRKTLVVLQAALSLALLSAAGLLTAALQKLETQDFGFSQEHRIVARMNPRLAGYGTAQLSSLYRRLLDSAGAIPGVSSAALCMYAPQSGGNWGSGVWVEGHPPPGPRDDNFASWNRVTTSYLDVIGTPIVKGRGFSGQDTATSPKVAVVNEAFARKFFPNEDPIGRHFGPKANAGGAFEVVGVMKDARYLTVNFGQPERPFFFLPEVQADYTQRNTGSLYLSDIVILTKPGVSLASDRVRQAVASVDRGLPILFIRTLNEQVSAQFTQQRLIARLTSLFGILSLVLASLGLYGVTAYNAGLRTNEIGVRMALGATRGSIIRLVLRGAFLLILIGLSIGLPLGLGAGRFLGSQLYGLDPYHPGVILVALLALGFSALVASVIPALRASSIAPSSALRSE